MSFSKRSGSLLVAILFLVAGVLFMIAYAIGHRPAMLVVSMAQFVVALMAFAQWRSLPAP